MVNLSIGKQQISKKQRSRGATIQKGSGADEANYYYARGATRRIQYSELQRNGAAENVKFHQITERIQRLCYGLSESIDPSIVSQKVCSRIHDGITSSELDELSAEICIHLTKINYDYSTLASRIIINNHHKNTSDYFSDIVNELKDKDYLDENFVKLVEENKDRVDKIPDHSKDYLIDYFGFKTLEKSYLFKNNNKIIERPQYVWLRVSLCIHGDDWENVEKCYKMMSNKYFTHATPTLFNAGTPRP